MRKPSNYLGFYDGLKEQDESVLMKILLFFINCEKLAFNPCLLGARSASNPLFSLWYLQGHVKNKSTRSHLQVLLKIFSWRIGDLNP